MPEQESRTVPSGRRTNSQVIGQPLFSLPLIVAVAIVWCAIAFVYVPVLSFEFVSFDDPTYVVTNRHVQMGLTPTSIVWAWTTGEMSNWHPLTWLSLQLDRQLYGNWAGGFHLTNGLLHALGCTGLLLALVKMTRRVDLSLAVVLLSAVHPLHVESVAWVSERKGILSTCFWMWTMWAYARYVEHPTRARYAWVVALLTLGLLAKQMLVTLPLALLLLDLWPLRRSWSWRLVTEKLPLFGIAAAFTVIAYIAQDRGGSVSEMPWATRLTQVPVAYWLYLGDAFWPIRLYAPDMGSMTGFSIGAAAVASLAIIVMTLIVLLRQDQQPYWFTGWMWYLVTFLPVIGIIPIGVQWRADRYTDIPLIGIIMATVWMFDSAIRSSAQAGFRRGALMGGGLVLVTLVVLAHRQTYVWENSVSLWTNTITCDPDHPTAAVNLGKALLERGRIADAVPWFETGVEVARNDQTRAVAHYNLGLALFELRRIPESIAQYEAAIQLDEDEPEPHNNLGNALYVTDRLDSARTHLERAIELRPDYAIAYYNLGNVLSAQQQSAPAKQAYQQASKLAPQSSKLQQRALQKALSL
ncbi:tetratricopeptide repeat protein [bacterium]|nr:tetratricopeptide repeat protein [bacterium]